jgi:hypothetical protein
LSHFLLEQLFFSNNIRDIIIVEAV